MKIAIFTDTYAPDKNGVSASIDRFTKLMADDGHEILIFCPKGKVKREPRYTNITVKRYPSIPMPSYKDMQITIPFVWSAVSDLKDFDPDVVHIQTPMGIGWIGIWATKILKIKNLQTYHTYIPDFLVYLDPATLLGIKKMTNFVINSRFINRLSKTDLFDDDSLFEKLKDNVAKIWKHRPIKSNNGKTKGFSDRFGREYTKVIYNRADLVLTPSDAMRKILKKQGVKARVEVQSNGVDYDYFKKKTDFKITNKLVYLGRLGHEKNVDVIIKAFNVAQRLNPNLRLDILGDGPARKPLQSLARNYGLGKKVRFLGAYDIAKVSKTVCNYDCFVTASTIETQGIVILEAMAAGLPVLGVNKLAVPEVVLHGKNGYISEPFDVDEMANNMLKIVSSSDRIERFSKKSLEIAKTHEIINCKNQLFKVYERMAAKK